MKFLKPMIAVVLVSMTAGLVTSQLFAQTERAKPSDQVPQAALLTERGKQLAEELRLLKRSRETMGPKHPSLPLVNKKIEAIQEQLQAWEPAANPFRPESGEKTTPQMNEYDLRQMVIRLNKRVEMLEKRVSQLEAK